MSAVNVVTLLYHSIFRGRDTNEFYDIDASVFESHLRAAQVEGLECISARDLAQAQNVGSNSGDKLLLTFDDGKRDHYETVLPLLEGCSMRGTFFVNPDRVGKPEYLDWPRLREMDRRGMSIQSHGLTHRYLHELGEGDLDLELRASKSEIEQRIGRRVDFLSVPGGFFTKSVVESAWSRGFLGVFTSEPGSDRVEFPVRSILFHRYNMTRSTTSAEVIRVLRRNWILRQRLRVLSGIKRGARKAIGTSAYHWGWKKMRKFVR